MNNIYIDLPGLLHYHSLLSLLLNLKANKQDVYTKLQIDNKIGNLGNQQEAIPGEHYTQEEIDNAIEGDDAYGKTVDDWKIEPQDAIPHTIKSYVDSHDYIINQHLDEVDSLILLLEERKANIVDLSEVAFSGSYLDLLNKPTIGNAQLNLKVNNTSVGIFTANSTTDVDVNLSVPELDNQGKIPQQYLPSYVDDIIEGYLYDNKFYLDTQHTKEIASESGKIYVDITTNLPYRWGGSQYIVMSSALALGETSTTAYRGDRGKAAYDHSQAKGSAFTSGLYKITTNSEGHVISATTVIKDDITVLGIPASNTTYSAGTGLTLSNTTFSISQANASTIINLLSTVSSNPTDTDYYISQYAGGGTTTTTYHRRPHSALYDYIKTKLGISNKGATLAWNTTSTIASVGGVDIKVTMPSNPDTNTITGVKGNSEATYRTGNVNITKANIGLGNVTNYDQSKAIKSITRSGTTFTYTALDGTTGTFTQQDNNTTYSFSDKNATLAWGTKSTIATVGGTDIHVTMPANPNTNTWRGITDSYSGTDSATSLSQKGGNALYNALLNGYASSAGNADTVDGYHAASFAYRNSAGGIAGCDGIGQYNYFLLATIKITSAYINRPITFEISQRGVETSWIQVMFADSNGTDPSLGVFTTNNSNRYYIYKSARSTWQVYGYYTGAWGSACLHRILGCGADIGVTVNMTNASSLPSGSTQVSYGGVANYANSAGTALIAEHLNNIILYDPAILAWDTITSIAVIDGNHIKVKLPAKPTVNNGTLNLQASGTTKTTFTANQSGNSTFNIATGSSNGTISVGGTNVAVKGLGNLAYASSLSRLDVVTNQRNIASSSSTPSTKYGGLVVQQPAFYMSTSYGNDNDPAYFGNVINMIGDGHGQLFCSWEGSYTTGRLYYRSHRDNTSSGGWTPWKRIAYSDDNTSDIRLKNIIENTSIPLTAIANSPLFKFTWKNKDIDNKEHIGSSAQYWKDIVPDVVNEEKDEIGTLSLQYDVLALASAKTLAQEILELKEQIKSLQEEINILKNK